jgi:hypothetical protein
MIKPLLSALLACMIVGASAHAATFKLPDEGSVASVTIPDAWKPKEIERGVESVSPDGAVYLAVESVEDEKNMDASLNETFDMLKEHKVVVDKDSKKENKFKINDLEASELLFQGKDEDGPTSVSIVFVPVKSKVLVITYWVTTSEEKKHQAAVGKIVQSIKAL